MSGLRCAWLSSDCGVVPTGRKVPKKDVSIFYSALRPPCPRAPAVGFVQRGYTVFWPPMPHLCCADTVPPAGHSAAPQQDLLCGQVHQGVEVQVQVFSPEAPVPPVHLGWIAGTPCGGTEMWPWGLWLPAPAFLQAVPPRSSPMPWKTRATALPENCCSGHEDSRWRMSRRI